MNIAITGLTGTGSSALIDMLKEFEDVGISKDIEYPYEHAIFYINNGIFDLKNKLLYENTIFKSDAAISDFKKAMNLMSQEDFGWFGSYNKILGKEFDELVNSFIDEISIQRKGTSYNQYIGTRFSLIKAIAQLAVKIIEKKQFNGYGRRYILEKRPMYFSMPTEEIFYRAAQNFVNGYFELMKSTKNITIYDHLILPQQIELIPKFFNKNLKVIIVERDPRDLYILNKYFWYKKIGAGDPVFPTTASDFIEYWKNVNSYKKDVENVKYVNFEDLIYKYDATIIEICDFLNIKNHKNKGKFFIVEKSIKNTQTFTVKPEWREEVKIIEKNLKEYLYKFPYESKTSVQEFFDR